MSVPYKYCCLLFFCLLVSYTYAQEICNNAKDDDNDGFIDLHDPDCQCHFTVAGNLLQNGSFESFDHCPVNYIYSSDHNIADYWEYGSYTNTSLTDFYHNLRCSYDSSQFMLMMPPSLPLPNGTGFISILNSAYIQP